MSATDYPPSSKPDHAQNEIDQKQKWFDERYQEGGCSFGLRINKRLHAEQSKFQHIEIYDTQTFGKLMVIDGCTMLTSRDNFLYHEMMTHPALLTHPKPARVAIIGGGDCGSLKEVLGHQDVEQAWQVDIDERVTRLSEHYFPELCERNDDPRAKLLFADGIQWMRDQAENSLDVVIIDSTDPVGPAEGLFATDFYADCFRALDSNGLLVQQTESPLLHASTIISKAHRDMKSVGFQQTASLNFPQPVYPSGWWSATLASKGPDLRGMPRPLSKTIKTKYYSSEMHQAARVLPPFLEDALK